MGFLSNTNSAFTRLQSELNQLMRMRPWDEQGGDLLTLGAEWAPSVDVKTEKGKYLIRADLPGVDPSDIDISLDKEFLTIRGERKDEQKTEENGFQRVERFSGSFFRRLALPGCKAAEEVSARVHNGVLEITVPREEATPPRKITVST